MAMPQRKEDTDIGAMMEYDATKNIGSIDPSFPFIRVFITVMCLPDIIQK